MSSFVLVFLGQMYIQQQMAAQDRLMCEQDSRLDMMSDSMGTLRNVSGAIGAELDEQAVMLDEFGTEIENAESKLDATMRKMVITYTFFIFQD